MASAATFTCTGLRPAFHAPLSDGSKPACTYFHITTFDVCTAGILLFFNCRQQKMVFRAQHFSTTSTEHLPHRSTAEPHSPVKCTIGALDGGQTMRSTPLPHHLHFPHPAPPYSLSMPTVCQRFPTHGTLLSWLLHMQHLQTPQPQAQQQRPEHQQQLCLRRSVSQGRVWPPLPANPRYPPRMHQST